MSSITETGLATEQTMMMMMIAKDRLHAFRFLRLVLPYQAGPPLLLHRLDVLDPTRYPLPLVGLRFAQTHDRNKDFYHVLDHVSIVNLLLFLFLSIFLLVFHALFDWEMKTEMDDLLHIAVEAVLVRTASYASDL